MIIGMHTFEILEFTKGTNSGGLTLLDGWPTTYHATMQKMGECQFW